MTPKQLCGLRIPTMMPMGAAHLTTMIANGPKPPKIHLPVSSVVLIGLARKTHKVVFGWVMNEGADGIQLCHHLWVLKLNVNQLLCLVVLKSRTPSSEAATKTIVIGTVHRAPYSMAMPAKARSLKETSVHSCSFPQHTA